MRILTLEIRGMFVIESPIIGASNAEIFFVYIPPTGLLPMALCAKRFVSNRSLSLLQGVRITDDFATVVVTGTTVEGLCP
jgi:hypothetical protein